MMLFAIIMVYAGLMLYCGLRANITDVHESAVVQLHIHLRDCLLANVPRGKWFTLDLESITEEQDENGDMYFNYAIRWETLR